MQGLAQFVIRIFKFHKLKLMTAMLSALIMGFLTFPYGDLSDLVSSQVSQLSRNQIYLEFDSLGLSVWPTVGVKLEKVLLDTPIITSLEAGSLSMSPSIGALLTLKAGASVFLQDFIGGNLGLRFSGSSSLSELDASGDYGFSAESLSLEKVSQMLGLDFEFKGSLGGSGDFFFDSKLETPPSADFQFSVNQFQLLPALLQIPNLGPMNVPGLNLEQVSAKGRFLPSDRGSTAQVLTQEFILEEFLMGTERDILSGRVRGKLEVRLQKLGRELRPIIGAYEFRVQINTKPESKKDFGLFLSFLDSHKKAGPSGDIYQFRVASSSPNTPPTLSALPVFQ